MADVLGLERSALADDSWRPFAFFDRGGRCTANVEAALLQLMLDGSTVSAAAIRSVAVAQDWRGRGLFRALMAAALGWCDALTVELTFLYTAEPTLYGRFGFRPIAQHAFIGPAPTPRAGLRATRLDISNRPDRASIARLIETRAPLSLRTALRVPASLVLANLAKDRPTVALTEEPPTLIVYQDEGDTIVLVDIATSAVADLPTVLGALERSPRHIKTLFPPDRLDWHGEPVLEDTGLMMRGAMPDAMTRPFMFPPTAEF